MSAEIAYRRVRLQWHVGFWDGPLNGMCDVDGIGRCWFQCQDMDAYERRFDLYRLTPELQAAEDERHALWREMVGDHCDYVDNRRPAHFSAKDHPNWHDFYELPPLDRSDFTNPERLVGWFRRSEVADREATS